MAYDVPITVIIFNRPEITKILADVISQVNPDRLFIISDGARKDHAGEEDKVAKCRMIMEDVGRDSEIIKCYSDENMGCDSRIVSGLNFVFSQVDRSIILEDDCIPDISFFRYSKELLEKYKDNDSVMYVSGSNRTHYKMKTCYTFSYEASTWGWATWSRAWQHYRDGRTSWEKLKHKNNFRKYMGFIAYRKYCKALDVYSTWKTFPWDVAWQMQMMEQNGLGVVPCVNMVKNVGYGEDATHTQMKSSLQEWKVGEMEFPMVEFSEKVKQDKGYIFSKNMERYKERMMEKICYKEN